jgi:hypothetical protein
MRSTFVGVRSLFKSRNPKQAVDLNPGFEVDLLGVSEMESSDRSSPYIKVDLPGEVFGIEYKTPHRSLSRRKITIEGFKQSKAGEWSICGYCFTHRGPRSFSIDRVQALFNTHGEPVALSEFFPPSSDHVLATNLRP